jgi:hypothetical protein
MVKNNIARIKEKKTKSIPDVISTKMLMLNVFNIEKETSMVTPERVRTHAVIIQIIY